VVVTVRLVGTEPNYPLDELASRLHAIAERFERLQKEHDVDIPYPIIDSGGNEFCEWTLWVRKEMK
jgi:hypothetical protein